MRKPKNIREANKTRVDTIVSANKQAMPELVLANRVAVETVNGRKFSTGYRMSPNPNVSHKFSIHPGRDTYTHHVDQILTAKQRKTKYRHSLKDSEFYDLDAMKALKVRG